MLKLFVRLFFLFAFVFLIVNQVYAHVELTYPQGGEVFKPADTIVIRWVEVQSHDTQNWELYYSPNGGETWETISANIAVPLREFEWILPQEITKKGRIKVVQNNAVTDYEDVSPNFTVEEAAGIFEDSYSLQSFHNFPNPFRGSTTFSFTLEQRTFLSLKIFNIQGSFVETVVAEEMSAGSHQLSWNSKSLKAGVYFYTIRMGNAIRTKKFQIIQ